MSEQEREDHDQRLKLLLREFLREFFLCFFPQWAAHFDFNTITWLDKEVFLSPPQGERRTLDLVARIALMPDAPPVREGLVDLVVLVHIEIEAGESSQPIKPRMFEYYVQLRRDLNLPVLPIGLFLRVGLDGIGWDAYEEHFWDHRLLRFEYAYVGLPALDGEQHAMGENLLGVALSTLMKVPRERKVEVYAEALKRVALARQNDYRRHLLAECLEAYVELNEKQSARLQELLASESFLEVKPVMITTFERGKIAGKLEGERATAMLQLEAKFGPLTEEVKQRVEAMPAERVRELLLEFARGKTLAELGLQD